MIFLRPPEWTSRGLCAQIGGNAWFPEPGENVKQAKRICARCEVQPECREWGLTMREPFGIWGGLSREDRRKVWADADQAAAEAEEVAA